MTIIFPLKWPKLSGTLPRAIWIRWASATLWLSNKWCMAESVAIKGKPFGQFKTLLAQGSFHLNAADAESTLIDQLQRQSGFDLFSFHEPPYAENPLWVFHLLNLFHSSTF
jgi:hypothetical protein